jgi:hypothetical protein
VSRPFAGELARLGREPLRAGRLLEALDREDPVLAGNEAAVRDGRVVAGERRGDEGPHVRRDLLQAAELLFSDDGAERLTGPPRAKEGRRGEAGHCDVSGTGAALDEKISAGQVGHGVLEADAGFGQ